DARANAIRGGCGEGTLLDDGVVPALWDQPGDRIQVARAFRRRRPGRPEGSLSRADALPSPHRWSGCRAFCRGPSSSSPLGDPEGGPGGWPADTTEPGRHPAPPEKSSSGSIWSKTAAAAVASTTRAAQQPRPRNPTNSGRPTSKASSKLETLTTATP